MATVGLLVAGVALLRTPAQGCLAGAVLLATPYFLHLASVQYADVPVGFYLLAVALAFEAHDRRAVPDARLPLLAGLAAGMAFWTKNEGQLYLVATVTARLVVNRVGRRGWRALTTELLAFGGGLLPFAVTLAYFKLLVAARNDLIAGQEGGRLLPRLTDGGRTK